MANTAAQDAIDVLKAAVLNDNESISPPKCLRCDHCGSDKSDFYVAVSARRGVDCRKF